MNLYSLDKDEKILMADFVQLNWNHILAELSRWKDLSRECTLATRSRT
jgi:hypothetical protein